MKKLLLAKYDFRTGSVDHEDNYIQVAIDSTPTTPDHHDVERAEATFSHWFHKAYPKSNLVSLKVTPAVTELTTFHYKPETPENCYTADDLSRYADWLWFNNFTPNGSQTIEEWNTAGRPTR